MNGTQPRAKERTLRWWSKTALNPLRDTVADAINLWGAQWGINTGVSEAFNACESPVRPESLKWHPLTTPGLWMGYASASPTDNIEHTLFGMPGRSAIGIATIAVDVASKALDALSACLAPIFAVEHACSDDMRESGSLSPHDLKPWSGAAHIHIPMTGLQETGLTLHLAPRLAEKLAAGVRRADRARFATRSSKLTPILQTIGHKTLRLKVELHPAEVSLGELQSLALGDVLALSHRLDAPLTVRSGWQPEEAGETQPHIFHAYLGARRQHRAIEVLRTDADFT